MSKETNLIIRMNEATKNGFNELAARNGLTMSAVINSLVLDMLNEDKIPSNINKYVGPHCDLKYKILTVSEIKELIIKAIHSSNNQDKIIRVFLFGSYSRGEANEESDIDIRIETTQNFSLFDLSRLHADMVSISHKEVDIATQDPKEMDQAFYNVIRKEEMLIYERT